MSLEKGITFYSRHSKKVLAEVPNAHLLVCGYGFPHEIKQVSGYVKDMRLHDHVHLRGSGDIHIY